MSIVFITVILFSCKGKEDINTYTVKERGSALDSVVREMAEANRLEEQYIGVGGTPSKQWKRFEWLTANASDSELVRLTGYKNPIVKCYAFKAIQERGKIDALTVLLKNISDSTRFETMSGCIIGEEIVADYFLANYSYYNRHTEVIDSAILYGENLKWRNFSLSGMYPTKSRYNRFRELVVSRKSIEVIVPLAKYKRDSDKMLIAQLLKEKDDYSLSYALDAVANFPDQSFFPALEKMLSDELRKTNNTYSGNSEALYKALAQYKSKKVRKLFDRVLRDMKGEQLVKHSDFIYQAVKENPDPIYDGLRYRHTYF